jgi:uncharacterized protein (DUF1330 family)
MGARRGDPQYRLLIVVTTAMGNRQFGSCPAIARPMTRGVIDPPPTAGEGGGMATYAVAHMQTVEMGPAIVEYLQRIDATLAPFEGRFLVHGDPPDVLEGEFPGHLIVIEFPTRAQAEGWYASPAYREILPLRRENSTGPAILVDGCAPDHLATDVLA